MSFSEPGHHDAVLTMNWSSGWHT